MGDVDGRDKREHAGQEVAAMEGKNKKTCAAAGGETRRGHPTELLLGAKRRSICSNRQPFDEVRLVHLNGARVGKGGLRILDFL